MGALQTDHGIAVGVRLDPATRPLSLNLHSILGERAGAVKLSYRLTYLQ